MSGYGESIDKGKTKSYNLNMPEPTTPRIEQGVTADQTVGAKPAKQRGSISRAAQSLITRFGRGGDPGKALAGIAGQEPFDMGAYLTDESAGKDQQPQSERIGVTVDIGGGRLGSEITTPGESFSLSLIFEPQYMVGNDKYTGVYIDTASGNKYLVS